LQGAAYAVLFCTLVFFTILALGSMDYFHGFLPTKVTSCCLLKTKGEDEVHSADYFLSARNSAGPFAIAMSFFAGGMGAWVVYGTTEMGANPGKFS
jgi:SSS family solute:Na+ symporter